MSFYPSVKLGNSVRFVANVNVKNMYDNINYVVIFLRSKLHIEE